MNVCFTADGLRACGLTDDVMCTFPPEFREGIVTPARSRILGDTQESDPSRWEFGGPGAEPLHALLIVHGYTEEALVAACTAQRELIAASNGAVSELGIDEQRGVRPTGDYEPFGFHDGISQPKIDGLKGPGVPTGEFILGYLNHYGLIAGGPVVPRTLDPSGVLPALENPYHLAANLADLGRHGSYVVYRKLQQDVAGFWRFMRDEAARRGARDVAARAIRLAAKCVGRWPSGAPLIESPTTDRPGLERFDAFGYAGDPHGLACPIGAHIRRTHPRDDLKPYPTQQSLSMSEAHRLLRRARVFGTPLIDPKQLQERVAGETLANLPDDGQPRGIHFFCVNASIKSQFEFVQQSWCNNPHFGGLYDNKDPITGDHGRRRPGAELHGNPERHQRGPPRPAPPLRHRPSRRVLLHAGAESAQSSWRGRTSAAVRTGTKVTDGTSVRRYVNELARVRYVSYLSYSSYRRTSSYCRT